MLRAYENAVLDSVNFFIGTEVEKTPAYNLKTLFVVGVHRPQEIIELVKKHKCDHIYLGANQSFNFQIYSIDEWTCMIDELLKIYSELKTTIYITLDFDVSYIEIVAESGFNEYHNFIPQISVKIPYIQLLNYNATLKIDDIGFSATNPGVWCHSLHTLQDRSVYTNWKEYEKDKPV